jgi:hypothetical protein
MAVKPPDFKASGIRAERLIASGSAKKPQLLIINETTTGNDGITVDTDTLKLTGTGSDTWLYVSGAIGGNDRVTFGGDVYISGSLFGVAVSATPSAPVNSVQYNNAGAFGGSNSLTFDLASSRLSATNIEVANQLVVTGTTFLSGSVYVGDGIANDYLYVNALLASDIVPDGDRTRNLGSSGSRFANVYTGDLHLRNDRGDWTIVEEEDFLCVVNNKTGKRYKMMLQPLD